MCVADEQHSELELTEHGFFSRRARGKWLCHPLHFPSFLRFPPWNKARILWGEGGLLCAWNEQEKSSVSGWDVLPGAESPKFKFLHSQPSVCRQQLPGCNPQCPFRRVAVLCSVHLQTDHMNIYEDCSAFGPWDDLLQLVDVSPSTSHVLYLKIKSAPPNSLKTL